MDAVSKLRLSRSTNNLEKLIAFYCSGLGFEVLDRYEDLLGWDGVIVGHRGWPYQMEFSQKRETEEVPRAPSPNHFAVISIPDEQEWKKVLGNLFDAGFQQVTKPKLYADEQSAAYEDPDGYRVVIRCGSWNGTWKK